MRIAFHFVTGHSLLPAMVGDDVGLLHQLLDLPLTAAFLEDKFLRNLEDGEKPNTSFGGGGSLSSEQSSAHVPNQPSRGGGGAGIVGASWGGTGIVGGGGGATPGADGGASRSRSRTVHSVQSSGGQLHQSGGAEKRGWAADHLHGGGALHPESLVGVGGTAQPSSYRGRGRGETAKEFLRTRTPKQVLHHFCTHQCLHDFIYERL